MLLVTGTCKREDAGSEVRVGRQELDQDFILKALRPSLNGFDQRAFGKIGLHVQAAWSRRDPGVLTADLLTKEALRQWCIVIN